MASFDLPQTQQPSVSSALLVGVASPLWTYFGAAALGGVAYWWMTQWTRPANLEAILGGTRSIPPVIKPALSIVESGVVTVAAMQDAAAEALAEAAPFPVGGEAAPISPLTAAAAELPAPPAPPEVDAAPESFAEAAVLPAAPSAPEPSLEAKPAVDATPEPLADEPGPTGSEFAAKPRLKKTPPTVSDS